MAEPLTLEEILEGHEFGEFDTVETVSLLAKCGCSDKEIYDIVGVDDPVSLVAAIRILTEDKDE